MCQAHWGYRNEYEFLWLEELEASPYTLGMRNITKLL